MEPDFALVKLEGDAVFAAAPAASLDGQGDRVLEKLGAMYRAFIDGRTRAIPSSDHICTACPAVAHLDLKVVLHRGHAVRQTVGSGSDLLGPAVTVAHRLLKNTIRERIGFRPYLFLTDAAATALGLSQVGLAHREEYPDAGEIQGRIVELGEPVREGVPTLDRAARPRATADPAAHAEAPASAALQPRRIVHDMGADWPAPCDPRRDAGTDRASVSHDT